MQVLSLSPSLSTPPCLIRAIPDVIETVGRPGFSGSLFSLARRFAGAEHLTAFLTTNTGRRRTVLAENVGPPDLALSISHRYIDRFWDLDPANQILIDDNRADHSWALRISASDITNAAYKSECYLSAGLAERFSLIQKRAQGTMRVNFYLGREETFGDGIVEKLMDSAPLLMASLWRHQEASAVSDGADMAPAFRDKLEKVAPTLSSRELDVCSLVATGITSEGISLKLGVGINTVLTYRKRAYHRLRISSQNELMRMLM